MEPTTTPIAPQTNMPPPGGGLTLAQVQAMGGTVNQPAQPTSIADMLNASAAKEAGGGTPNVNSGKGLTLAQVQALGGKVAAGSDQPNGSIEQYQEQSANPASTASNPDPGLWDRILAGTPLNPITIEDVKGQSDPLLLIGNIFSNAISDIPAIAHGVVQLIDPRNWGAILSGLVKGASNITGETVGAISDGLTTGNWSRLGQDTQKATITIGNHPLQSLLGLDGALDATSFGVGAARDAALAASDPAINFSDTPTGQMIARTLLKVQVTKANIANLFAHQTTLTEHAVQLADLSKQLADANNEYTSKANTLDSIKQQYADAATKLSEAKNEVANSIGEDKITKQQGLDAAQEQFDKITQDTLNAQKEAQVSADNRSTLLDKIENETHQQAANQKGEAALKSGLGNQEDNLEGAVSDHVSKSFDEQSELYKQTLGNAKISSDTIIKGLEDYKNKLRDSSKRDSVPLAQAAIDELKLRDIVNSATNEQDLYKKLSDSGVDPKKWENLNPEQLKQEYTPLTSENFKQVRNSLYDGISRKANETSEYQYNSTVKPAFDKAFGDAIKDQYGSDRLDSIKQIDKAWANLKNNPLFKDGTTITLDKITKDWNDFARSVGKTPGGSALIEQIRNFAAERVMTNAEDSLKQGTFDYSKIVKGVDKYENVLGKTLSDRLLQTAQDYKNLEDRRALNDQALKENTKSLKESLNEKKTEINKTRQSIIKESTEKIAEKTEKIKQITTTANKIASDAKAIGGDKPDFLNSIQKIDSPEKLTEFLNKTGKSAEEIGSVVLQKEMSPIDEAFKNATVDGKFNEKLFDPKIVGDVLDRIDKIGKNDESVRSALLGPEKEEALNALREKYDEWQKESKAHKGNLTLAQRAEKIAKGTLIVTILPFGKFFGYRSILEGILPSGDFISAAVKRAKLAGKLVGDISPSLRDTSKVGVITNTAKENK